MLGSSTYIVTGDTMAPLLDGITANISVLLPVGLSVFAVLCGVSIIVKVIRMWF